MTKKEALSVLIRWSGLFSHELKGDLIARLDVLPPSDVQALGELLAAEKRDEIENQTARLAAIDALINSNE